MNDFTIILKNLFRKKLRTFLMLFAIFIAFFLYASLGALNGALNAPSKSADANRLVVVNKINFTQPLPIYYYDQIKQMKGVANATHMNWFGAYFRDPRNVITTFAADMPTYFAIYHEIVLPEDQRKAVLGDRTAVAVGKTLADKYGWKLGQTIPINSNIFSKRDGSHSWDFTIRGIFTTKENTGRDSLMLFHYDYFKDTVSFGGDSIGWLALVTEDESQNDAIAKAIDSRYANSPYETKTDTAAAFNKAFIAQLGNIGLIIGLVVGAAFVTILMIVGNTMVMAVRERTKEIGVFKTLGFTGPRILSHVLGESLLLALLGGLLGLLGAHGASILLNQATKGQFGDLKVTSEIIFGGIGWMILLGVITGLFPAWQAMRLNIVTALGRK